MADDPGYVVRLDRGAVSMWLSSTLPVRWGPREQAMRFKTKGEARRAAADVKAKGAWSVEDA